MEVDPAEVKVAFNHTHQAYQKHHRLKSLADGEPNLEDFTAEENKLSRRKPKAGDPPYIPDPAVMRRYNIKVRARNAAYTRHLTGV
jgi:hypothetical protein